MRRSRIVRIKNYIIVTNFKCMFSSINKLNLCEKDPKINSDHTKIFLYRDINKRAISCFLNWMVCYPNEQNVLNITHDNKFNFGWLIGLLNEQEHFDFNTYLSLLKQENLIELFKMYLFHLPKIYKKNGHTRDQYTIVKKNNYNVDIFINTDNKKEVEHLETIIDQKIVCCNENEKNKKELLLNFIKKNKKYSDIIKEVYKRDIDFLPIYK